MKNTTSMNDSLYAHECAGDWKDYKRVLIEASCFSESLHSFDKKIREKKTMLNCVQPTLLREDTLLGGSAEPQVTSTPRSEIAVSLVQEDFLGKMKFEPPTEG